MEQVVWIPVVHVTVDDKYSSFIQMIERVLQQRVMTLDHLYLPNQC